MPLIQQFLETEAKEILFFPYAGVNIGGKPYPESYDAYTERVANVFKPFGITVKSVHQAADPIAAVNNAQVIAVGGGNTFHLVYELHRNHLIAPVRRKVMEGTPYFGWSAGANVACPTLRTTNDMPIIMPESFDCFDLVPFQINPHYIDPYPQEINDTIRHGGETRQDRINEFLAVNQEITVVGLREATALWVQGDQMTLKGERPMRLLRYGQEPAEIQPESTTDFGFRKR